MILLQTLLLAWFITKFEPLHTILNSIRYIIPNIVICNIIYNNFTKVLSCLKCASFWIGLIMGGFWIGCAASFIAYIYMNTLQPQIDKIRFL